MDPYEFYFLILPLAALVIFLIIVVLLLSRNDTTIKHKDIETINELVQTGQVNKQNFSIMLQNLVHQGIIDKKSYTGLGKIIDESLNESQEASDNFS
jgi:hypothetical protein